MDFRGGYGPPRVDNRPLLTIFADGTVRVIDHSRIKISAQELRHLLRVIEHSGIKFSAEERRKFLRVDTDKHSDIGPEIEAKVTAEELQDLLRFVIDEQHFFEFDSVTAQQELEAERNRTGRMMHVSDGVTTLIRIQTAERDHKANFYALYEYATAYPAVKSLANLLSVEERLSHLVNEIAAGGKEGIAAALNLANEYLQTAYPNVPALVLEDFRCISHTPDRRTIHFVPTPAVTKQPDDRDPIMKLMAPEPQFSVGVEYGKDSTPKITVSNPPQ
jgi:hypothetical protein